MKSVVILFFIGLHWLNAGNTSDYIDRYVPIALQQMDQYGIPASIILSQALIESSSGTSQVCLKANNHFGVKKSDDWHGDTYEAFDDDKDANGKPKPSEFRKYSNVRQSFEDHSLFLTNEVRYRALFKLHPTDYWSWCIGLDAAGYATNPKYAVLLIEIIERFELYKYDIQLREQQLLGIHFNSNVKMEGVFNVVSPISVASEKTPKGNDNVLSLKRKRVQIYVPPPPPAPICHPKDWLDESGFEYR